MNTEQNTASVFELRMNGRPITLTVEENLPRGASCIAYRVRYFESGGIEHKAVLKELCPAFLREYPGFARSSSGLIIPAAARERFAKERERFLDAYRTINRYSAENLSAPNYHTVQLGLLEGNNTVYTLAAADFGKNYSELKEESPLTALKIALAVTKAIELYHAAVFCILTSSPKTSSFWTKSRIWSNFSILTA